MPYDLPSIIKRPHGHRHNDAHRFRYSAAIIDPSHTPARLPAPATPVVVTKCKWQGKCIFTGAGDGATGPPAPGQGSWMPAHAPIRRQETAASGPTRRKKMAAHRLTLSPHPLAPTTSRTATSSVADSNTHNALDDSNERYN